MEIEERSRTLFLKYALPCAGTLVKRCNITQEQWDSWINDMKAGKVPPKGSEHVFKVAMAACTLLAKDKGKTVIDEEVLREYYLFSHDPVIDARYEEMGDFDPAACRIRPGVVKEVANGSALVQNSLGTRSYRTDYCNVRKDDLVTTHWDFVVEKIDGKTVEMMNAQKRALKVM